MKYGVIICPKCGRARGVEAGKKTTTCQCGREMNLSRVKLKFPTESPMELAKIVGQVNEALAEGEPMPSAPKPRRKSPASRVAERAKSIKDPLERMRVIAEELTALKQEFTLADLRKVAGMIGKDSAEDMLARLLEHNLVYETQEGSYRSV